MHGRLGNQMFQYAAARALQEKNKQSIIINFRQVIGSNTEGTIGWENSLKYFNVVPCEYVNRRSLLFDMSIYKQIYCVIYVLKYRKYLKDLNKLYHFQIKFLNNLDKFGVRWIANGYYDFKCNNLNDYLLNGSFESPKYFDDIRDKLLLEFTPKMPELETNKSLYKIIKNNNSVCVSLRHFQLTEDISDMYDVCSFEYYKSAIDYMKSKLENPVFIIFSDDIEWAKKTLNSLDVEFVYETLNNPIWEKLRLMYSCRHFIIPNSTFAWWAQYLSRFNEKIVVSPARWFQSDFESPLILKNWVKIDRNGKIHETSKKRE